MLRSWLTFKRLQATGEKALPLEKLPNDYKYLAPLKFNSLIFNIENIFADQEGFILAAGAFLVWLLSQTPDPQLQALIPIWVPGDLLNAHPSWGNVISRLADQIFYHRLSVHLVLYGPIFEVTHQDASTYLTPTIVAQAVRREHLPEPTGAITAIWARREAEIRRVCAFHARPVSTVF